jgi:hypothetical protein
VPDLEQKPLEFDDLTKYLNEFDIKDIPQNFSYSMHQEKQMGLNMLNGFKYKKTFSSTQDDETQLISKL